MLTKTTCHTPTLSREAYSILEGNLHALKFRTLCLAITNARLQRHLVGCHDIDSALRKLSETGIEFSPDKTKQTITAPLDISLYLVKRLHNLRVLVFNWAVRLARADNSSEENTPLILSPENIQSAWSTIASNHLVLRHALLPDDVMG